MRPKNWILIALIGSSICTVIFRCSHELNVERKAELVRLSRRPLVLDRASIVQVSTGPDGSILVVGRVTTLDAVTQRFDQLGRGRVWVYRDGPADSPPPPTMQIIELASGRKLDVVLSGKPDFSDLVEAEEIVFRSAR
jgi:hypothetical protein